MAYNINEISKNYTMRIPYSSAFFSERAYVCGSCDYKCSHIISINHISKDPQKGIGVCDECFKELCKIWENQ